VRQKTGKEGDPQKGKKDANPFHTPKKMEEQTITRQKNTKYKATTDASQGGNWKWVGLRTNRTSESGVVKEKQVIGP